MLISSSHVRKLIGRSKEEAILTVKRVENPKDFGVISTSGSKVSEILEKPEEPPTDLANAGIYLFNSDIFNYIKQTKESIRGELEITDTLQKLIDEGKDVGYELLEDGWLDIGRPWDLLDANSFLLSEVKGRIEGTVEPFVTLHGEVIVGEGNNRQERGLYRRACNHRKRL